MRRRSIGEQAASKVAVGVFWDTEQCSAPPLYTPDQVVDNMYAFLRESFGDQLGAVAIQAYGGELPFSQETTASLLARDVTVAHTASKGEILLDMCLFALERQPPACMMLACSEGDYLPLAKATNKGYWLLVASPRGSTGPQVRDVTEALDWAQVATGTLVDRGACVRLADLLSKRGGVELAQGEDEHVDDSSQTTMEQSAEQMFWRRVAVALEADMMSPTSGNYRRYCLDLLDSDQIDGDLAACALDPNEWAAFVKRSLDLGVLRAQADGALLLPADTELWEVFTAVSDPFGSGVWNAAKEYFSSAVGRAAVKSCKGKHAVARLLQQAAREPCRGMPLAKLLHLVNLSVEKKLLVVKADNKLEVAGTTPVRTPERSLSRARSMQQVTPGTKRTPGLSKTGSEYMMQPRKLASPLNSTPPRPLPKNVSTPDTSGRKLRREPSTRSILSVLVEYPVVTLARLSALLLDGKKDVISSSITSSSTASRTGSALGTLHVDALAAQFSTRYKRVAEPPQLLVALSKLPGVLINDEEVFEDDNVVSARLRVNTAVLCDFDYAVRLGICAVLAQPIYEAGASLKQLLDDLLLLQRWDLPETRMTAWRAQVMILLTRWTDLVTITGRGTWTEKRVSRGAAFHENTQKLRLRLKSRLASLLLDFRSDAQQPLSPRLKPTNGATTGSRSHSRHSSTASSTTSSTSNGGSTGSKLTVGQLKERYRRTYGKKLAVADFNFPSEREMFMEMADVCYVDTSKKPQKATGAATGQLADSHEVVIGCLFEREVVKLQVCLALLEAGDQATIDLDDLTHKVSSRIPSAAFGQIAQEHILTHCSEWLVPSVTDTPGAESRVEVERRAIASWPGVAYQSMCFPVPVWLPSQPLRKPPGPLTLSPNSSPSIISTPAENRLSVAPKHSEQVVPVTPAAPATPEVTARATDPPQAVVRSDSEGPPPVGNGTVTAQSVTDSHENAEQPTSTSVANAAAQEVVETPVRVESEKKSLPVSVEMPSPIAPHALRFDHIVEQRTPVRAALDELARTQLQKLSDLLEDGAITAEQYSKMSVMVLKVAGFTH